MKKLYFAHSRSDYNTNREKEMLRKLNFVFSGCKIINPGAKKFQKKMEGLVDRMQSANEYIQPFLKIINECSCLVFMPLTTGKVSVGTYFETRHAEACKIPVYVWDGMKFVTLYRLDECHNRGGKLDYKDNWAILTIGKGYAKGEVEQNIRDNEVHIQARLKKKERRLFIEGIKIKLMSEEKFEDRMLTEDEFNYVVAHKYVFLKKGKDDKEEAYI